MTLVSAGRIRRRSNPPDHEPLTGEAALVLRVLKITTFILIFAQRVAIPFPGGYISPTLLAALGLAGLGYWRKWFVEDRRRAAAYVLGISACLISGLISISVGAPLASFTSLMLLTLVYAPFCLVIRPEYRCVYAPVLRFWSTSILVISAIAIVQILAQLLLGWTFVDYWLTLVPHSLTVQGYQEPYPIYYGASLIRSDGLFPLEPSFCSQLAGLGILIQLVLGERRRRILIFALAMVTTVSGTGLLLLAAGLATQMVRRGPRWSARVLAVAAIAIGVAALTPPGQAAIGRITEFNSRESSGNGRFIAPYQRMYDQLGGGLQDVFVGTGPGSADRQAKEIIAETNQPAIAPVVPKLVIEYGVLAALIFIIALLVFICGRPLSPTLAASMVMFHFVLSATLLDAQQVYEIWLLVSIFARASDEPRALVTRPAHRLSRLDDTRMAARVTPIGV